MQTLPVVWVLIEVWGRIWSNRRGFGWGWRGSHCVFFRKWNCWLENFSGTVRAWCWSLKLTVVIVFFLVFGLIIRWICWNQSVLWTVVWIICNSSEAHFAYLSFFIFMSCLIQAMCSRGLNFCVLSVLWVLSSFKYLSSLFLKFCVFWVQCFEFFGNVSSF